MRQKKDGNGDGTSLPDIIRRLEYLALEVSGDAREACVEAAALLGFLMFRQNRQSFQIGKLEAEVLEQSHTISDLREKLAELSGGEFVELAVAFYDKREVYDNCTVEVLTNTKTGDVSVGWYKSGDGGDGDGFSGAPRSE